MNRNSNARIVPRNTEESVDSQVAMSILPLSKTSTKGKQIVVRFDQQSYNKICRQASIEHRGLGEFVRHAALDYIENIDKSRE